MQVWLKQPDCKSGEVTPSSYVQIVPGPPPTLEYCWRSAKCVTMSAMAVRSVQYRLLPGTRAKAKALSAIAGACRFVWNQALSDQEELYLASRLVGAKAPLISVFNLFNSFTQLRAGNSWLQTLPAAVVRYTLKQQADAWRRYFTGRAGHPRYRGRYGDDHFTIPQAVRITESRLRVPRVGWVVLRCRGGNSYPDGKPKQVHVKRVCGKWYATVCYEVDLPEREDDDTAIGVDMNVGQIATSTGDIIRAPDVSRLEARRRRYQRMVSRREKGSNRRAKARHLLAKTSRRIAMVRRDWHHQTSRALANAAHTVVVEDLNVRRMTRSAGRRKRKLNRGILDTGWASLRSMVEYKAGRVVAVNPAYTSQTCHECGHVDRNNRKSQARFECTACGHKSNADVNAALNVLASGTGATGRGGGGIARPVKRQIGGDLLVAA